MAAWRSHLNTISTASELDEEISSHEETSADNGIPLAVYADKSDQEEASGDESEISRKSSAGNRNSRKKAGRRSSWKEEEIADKVDIVCNSEYYKRRLSSQTLKTQKTMMCTGSLKKIHKNV